MGTSFDLSGITQSNTTRHARKAEGSPSLPMLIYLTDERPKAKILGIFNQKADVVVCGSITIPDCSDNADKQAQAFNEAAVQIRAWIEDGELPGNKPQIQVWTFEG